MCFACLDKLADKRRENVGIQQIKIIIRPEQVCRHYRNKIRAILLIVCLAHLDAGNFRNGVRVVGRLELSVEKILLLIGCGANFG